MGNLFDSIKGSLFHPISELFGTHAKWVPSNSTQEYNGKVLFKDATESREFSDVDFDIPNPQIEFPKELFPNLSESVSAGIDETIQLDFGSGQIKMFNIFKTQSKIDGNMIIAFLNPIQ